MHNSYRYNDYSTLLNREITHPHACKELETIPTQAVLFYMQLGGTFSAATELLYGHTSEKENCSALPQFFQVFTRRDIWLYLL